MTRAYLSLGSNVGDRAANLAAAIAALARPDLLVRRVSSVWETEPLEFTEQPWFLNLVAEIETALEPGDLLVHLGSVETALKRERRMPKGPRTIDIDILLYGDRVIDSPGLTVPHPRMARRRFVLEPLAELAPDLVHPVSGATVQVLLSSVLDQRVRKSGRIAFETPAHSPGAIAL